MMSGARSLLILSAAALALTACGGKGRFAHRQGPDEFVVARQAPLVVPPDYSLTPPKPGAPRAYGIDPQQAAMEALFGPGAKAPPKSPGETSLLDDAKVTGDPTARATVGDPQTVVVDKGVQAKAILDAPAANGDVASVSTAG